MSVTGQVLPSIRTPYWGLGIGVVDCKRVPDPGPLYCESPFVGRADNSGRDALAVLRVAVFVIAAESLLALVWALPAVGS